MIYYSNIILNTAYCIFFRILNIKKAYLASKVCLYKLLIIKPYITSFPFRRLQALPERPL